MTKEKQISDPCLSCSKIGKRTKEGNLYCAYCPMKEAYLAAMFKACQIWTFRSDGTMFCESQTPSNRISNRLEMWTSKEYACRNCGGRTFTVNVEVRDESKRESIFAVQPEKRLSVTCTGCGAKVDEKEELAASTVKPKPKRRRIVR